MALFASGESTEAELFAYGGKFIIISVNSCMEWIYAVHMDSYNRYCMDVDANKLVLVIRFARLLRVRDTPRG